MGAIISMFGSKGPEIELDLDADAKSGFKNKAQEEVFAAVEEVLAGAPDVLLKVDQYVGCQELARTAMRDATTENEQKAFEGLLSAVDSISAFFNFHGTLQEVFPKLIKAIADDYSTPDALQEAVCQPLCLKLIQIVDFAIRFDQVRMLRPNLSNDFSYYRRLLPKFNKHPKIRIKDDEASGMALFTAQHIPMVDALIRSSLAAAQGNGNVSAVLALLGNSCLKCVREDRAPPGTDKGMMCARAMAGAVVLFDHCSIPHAFNRKAAIKTKEIVNTLKKSFAAEVALINAIRFNSKNFADAPPAIEKLFD